MIEEKQDKVFCSFDIFILPAKKIFSQSTQVF